MTLSLMSRFGLVLLFTNRYGEDRSERIARHKAMEDFNTIKKAQALGGSKAKLTDRVREANLVKQAELDKFNRARDRTAKY